MMIRELTNAMSRRSKCALFFPMKQLLVHISQQVNGRCISNCKTFRIVLTISYKCRKEIGAIVHTHSPTLLAFAISHCLPYSKMFNTVFEILGEVSEVPYCICGGPKLV